MPRDSSKAAEEEGPRATDDANHRGGGEGGAADLHSGAADGDASMQRAQPMAATLQPKGLAWAGSAMVSSSPVVVVRLLDAIGPVGGDSQPACAPSTSPPGFLPGSPISSETDLDATALVGETASLAASMRGAVLAPARVRSSKSRATSSLVFVSERGAPPKRRVSHPSTQGNEDDDLSVIPLSARLPRGTFTLRGEIMHAFVSYRVVTEGLEGNGLADRVASKIREMSVDPKNSDHHIPRHGWGVWLQSAKRPVPFRPEEAKVFLDKDCLIDGQSWLAGFIHGLVASMIFVPLLSWTEDDKGSLGGLSKIGVDGFDRVDNVLLELILATALREEPGAACQAILPVIVGPALEGGGFGTFPFHKLARLSDAPSRATNAQAAAVLRILGVVEEKVQAVLRLSVQQVVDSVLRNHCIQASSMEEVVMECGTRVLTSVLQEMRRLRSDPKYFERGRPMGSEVMEWLQEENLRSFAPLFVYHRLDSLDYVAGLEKERLSELCVEHEELFPRNGQKGAMGGELAKLQKAHSNLLCKTPPSCLGMVGPRPDERTLPLSERLERYRDEEASGMALMFTGNCLELFHTKAFLKWPWLGFWFSYAGVFLVWIATKPPQVSVQVDVSGTYAASAAIMVLSSTAMLPLVCSTARSFVNACFQIYIFLLAAILGFVGIYGWYGTVLVSFPLYFALNLAIRYRQKHFPSAFIVVGLIGLPLNPLADCAFSNMRMQADGSASDPQSRFDKTYGECLGESFRFYVKILYIYVAAVCFGVIRKYHNDFSARGDVREAREYHRAVWRDELSKVAATPEVADRMRRLAGGIGRDLFLQRQRAVQSLDVVRRVMAFLNQRAGRWSLRGDSIKARQVHGDIDLLFDEAAMVNEPFLDLMASLVAGVATANGPGENRARRTRRRSVTRAGSEEYTEPSTEDAASRGLTLERGPVKKPARALQKLVRLYGRDVAMLTDLVRCMVLAEDLRQVEALFATLETKSVVGLERVGTRGGGGGEEYPMLGAADDERIFRITAIKNRFDESYDDKRSGGYRDLSLNFEVGWRVKEGLVSFEKVRDWGRLECQQHICEIQVRLRSQHHQIVSKGLHTRYVELRNTSNT